jgi:thiamine-monophosphate kinase
VTAIPPSAESPGGIGRREDDVLKAISRVVSASHIPAGEVHIGDDAAVLEPTVGSTVISTDVSVWGIHLDPKFFSLHDFGYKAVAAAISDLAAMGARPEACVIAVTAPEGTDLIAIHEGIAEAALMTSCPVVGGDLSTGNDITLAVTVIGQCPDSKPILRSGAKAGEFIFVTAPLGRASAGLRLRRAGADLDNELVLAQRHPYPRLREGLTARDANVSAMMDLSDGLALDLNRMADSSGVGFELDHVPVALGATLEEALSGGEDYELIIVTPDPESLLHLSKERSQIQPILIGRTVSDPSVRNFEGQPLTRRGWQHSL